MTRRKLSDCTVHVSMRQSNIIADAQPDYARSMAMARMREDLAHHVANAKVTTHRDEFSTDHRLSLLVLGPDEFWEIVREEAMRLTTFMPPRP